MKQIMVSFDCFEFIINIHKFDREMSGFFETGKKCKQNFLYALHEQI